MIGVQQQVLRQSVKCQAPPSQLAQVGQINVTDKWVKQSGSSAQAGFSQVGHQIHSAGLINPSLLKPFSAGQKLNVSVKLLHL